MANQFEKNMLITDAIETLYKTCMEAHNQGRQLFGAQSYEGSTLRNVLNNNNSIIEVDNGFKLNIHVQTAIRSFNTKATQMDVSSYNYEDVSAIKLSEFSGNIQGVCDAYYLLTFQFKNNEKRHFFCKDAALESSIDVLLDNLPEEHLELISKKQFRTKEVPYLRDFWKTNWETSEVKTYYETSDTFIKDKFVTNILPLAHEYECLTIMDVGGGKGRLAEKLINLLIDEKTPFKYLLIEPDVSQWEIARERLTLYADSGVEVINASVNDFSTLEQYREYTKKVNGIILSGGPINEKIVKMEDAEKNLVQLLPLLADNGIIIATGLTPVFFTKKDFTNKYNLVVLSTVKRTSERSFGSENLFQYYVIKKPPTPTQDLEQEPPPSPNFF